MRGALATHSYPGEEETISNHDHAGKALNGGLRDAIFVALASAACTAPFVFGLRYYSDDWWAFREPLATSADRSWSALYAAVARQPMAAVRPMQILWYVVFEKLAPGDVTAVQLANNVVFALSAVLLFVALRQLPAMRGGAYSLVLIYVCLPTFSVAKMWYANHQAILGLFFFAVAFLLTVRLAAVRSRPVILALLPLLLLAAALSNLSYELFFGALLGLPPFVWAANGARGTQLVKDPRLVGALIVIAAGLAATTLFKLTYHYRFGLPAGPREFGSFLHKTAWMYLSAARTTFWTLGAFSPRAAVGILLGPYFSPWALAAPAALLVLALARERFAAHDSFAAIEPSPSPRFLVACGAVAFIAGYLPYLTNFQYSPKPWGEGNRGNIAAALGATLLFYAAFRYLRRRAPRVGLAILLLFCATGAFLQASVGLTWAAAAIGQDRVYTQVQHVLRQYPSAGGTVLLYHTCPYFGAGPVFPYGRDLAARMAIEDGYRGLQVGIIRPGMAIGPHAIVNPPDAWTPSFAYRSLRVIDLGENSTSPLAGPEAGRRYFATHPIDRSITCPFDFGVGNPLY